MEFILIFFIFINIIALIRLSVIIDENKKYYKTVLKDLLNLLINLTIGDIILFTLGFVTFFIFIITAIIIALLEYITNKNIKIIKIFKKKPFNKRR